MSTPPGQAGGPPRGTTGDNVREPRGATESDESLDQVIVRMSDPTAPGTRTAGESASGRRLSNELAQLRAENARLQAEINAQQGRRNTARDTPAHDYDGPGGTEDQSDPVRFGGFEYLDPTHMAANHVGRIKFRLPNDFDGEKKSVTTFLRQLRTYLSSDATLTEEAKIYIALDFCVGDRAGKWADRQSRMILEQHPDCITTLAEFGRKVKKTFGDPEEEARAQRELVELRQTTRNKDGKLVTRPLTEMIVEFEILAEESGYDEKALTRYWSNMLSKEIFERIYDAETMPVTLAQWKERSLRYEEMFKQRDIETGIRRADWWGKDRVRYPTTPRMAPASNARPTAWRGNFPPPSPAINNNRFNTPRPPANNNTQRFYNPTGGRDPSLDHVPMEIDRNQVRREPRTKQPIICWRCNQPGHVARNCPSVERVQAIIVEEGGTKEDKEEIKDFVAAQE